jgi:hypothetical protein
MPEVVPLTSNESLASPRHGTALKSTSTWTSSRPLFQNPVVSECAVTREQFHEALRGKCGIRPCAQSRTPVAKKGNKKVAFSTRPR